MKKKILLFLSLYYVFTFVSAIVLTLEAATPSQQMEEDLDELEQSLETERDLQELQKEVTEQAKVDKEEAKIQKKEADKQSISAPPPKPTESKEKIPKEEIKDKKETPPDVVREEEPPPSPTPEPKEIPEEEKPLAETPEEIPAEADIASAEESEKKSETVVQSQKSESENQPRQTESEPADGRVTFAPVVQKESPQQWGFTMMGGPYRPSNFRGQGDTFKSIYTGQGDNWPFEKNGLWTDIALEWQFFKKLGKLGLKLSSGSWIIRAMHDASSDNTSTLKPYTLFAIPLFLGGVYHLHLWDKIPLVPFVEASYGGFRIQQTEAVSKDQFTAIRTAFMYGAGIQFNLNFIDRKTARDFDINWGVNRTYFIAQVRRIKNQTVDEFDLSGQNLITGGLLFEF